MKWNFDGIFKNLQIGLFSSIFELFD